jgi:hypothetical protein
VSALLGWPDAPFASDAMTAHEAAAGATEVLQGAE